MDNRYICPKCGRVMNSYIEYNFGNVFVALYCYCGYNTRDCSTGIQTNRTDYKDIKQHLSSSSTTNDTYYKK